MDHRKQKERFNFYDKVKCALSNYEYQEMIKGDDSR